MPGKRKETDSSGPSSKRRSTGDRVEESSKCPYIYERLPARSIRILVLSPGKQEDSLQASLTVANLDEAPQYNAISYVWGPAIFSHTLWLPNGRLRITDSLFTALLRFRSTDCKLRLWADAVCINQQDIEERSAQVAMMGDVYRGSENTLIWLGNGLRSDAIACWMMAFLERFLAAHPYSDETPDVLASDAMPLLSSEFSPHQRLIQQRHCACASSSLPGSYDLDEGLQALWAFWKRPWFTRLWVVQEVKLSPRSEFHFGSHSCSLNRVRAAEDVHGLYLHDHSPELRDLLEGRTEVLFQDTRGGQLPADSFPGLLLGTSQRRVFEPRDRIFAILSCCAIQDSPVYRLLEPNHEIPIATLWKNVTNAWLSIATRDEQFAVLAIAGLQQRQLSLPSWVPSFSALDLHAERKHNSYWQLTPFPQPACAGGSALWRPTRCEEGALHISGDVVDVCATLLVGSEFPGGLPINIHNKSIIYRRRAVREKLLPWYLRCSYFAQHESPELHNDVLSNVMRRGTEIDFRLGIGITYQEVERHLLDVEVHKDFQVLPFWSACFDTTQLLASTSKGRFAWVPQRAQPGDHICLFMGAPYPFVLRPMDDG